MASLQEMIAKRMALDEEIREMQTKQRSEALSTIRQLMAEYGLTANDFRSPMHRQGNQSRGTGKTVAAKYRNSETGESWSGRGLQPKWLKAAMASGKKLDDFSLDKPQTPPTSIKTAAATAAPATAAASAPASAPKAASTAKPVETVKK